MIKHNYEFTYNGIASFTLPKGMCLDREARGAYDDSFQLISPDGRLRFYIEFFKSSKSAEELIEELNDPAEHEVLCPPRAIKTPAESEGYVITYSVGDERYEECTLEFGSDTRINFWLLQKASNPCDHSLYEKVKQEVLENIKIV